MVFSYIIKALLFVAGMFFCCVAFISRLNRSSGKEDMQQYKKDFNPYKPLAFYADNKDTDQDEFDDNKIKYYKN